MSEYTETAWEPDRHPPRRPRIIIPEVTETDPEFIGPRTSGDYFEEALCEECMGGFMARVFLIRLKEAFRCRYCPACVAAREAEEAAKSEANRPRTRADKWADVCPATYLKTDLDRLRKEGKLKSVEPNKMDSRTLVNTILARPLTERGMGLAGAVRLGKTRLMFALLRGYYLAGKRVMYVYAPDFSDVYAGLMGESPHRGNAYLETCINADLWFLDDLGKGRLSEAAQRALLRVVEKRTAQERPIFTTCNDDGNVLIARMAYEDSGTPSEYARPMVERLREFCDWYTF